MKPVINKLAMRGIFQVVSGIVIAPLYLNLTVIEIGINVSRNILN